MAESTIGFVPGFAISGRLPAGPSMNDLSTLIFRPVAGLHLENSLQSPLNSSPLNA